MQPINHQAIRRHMNNYTPVEQFTVRNYTFKLYALYEKGFGMDYQYNLIAYLNEEPVAALSYEIGIGSTNFLGATLAERHINLGAAPHDMDLLAFRTWAYENMHTYLENVEAKDIVAQLHAQTIASDAVSTFTGNPKEAKMSPYDLQVRKQIEALTRNLREFGDVVEYRFVQNFEMRYAHEQIQIVQLHNAHIVIGTDNGVSELLAIVFHKQIHTPPSVMGWLLQLSIVFAKAEEIDALLAGKQVLDLVEVGNYKAACVPVQAAE